MHTINLIIITAALLYATVTDIKTQMIPLWLFPSMAIVCTAIDIYTSTPLLLLDKTIGVLMCLVAYTVLAVFFNGGGGDIIMMCGLAWTIGTREIITIVILSSFFAIIYTLVSKKKILPYAPCVAMAFILRLFF